VFALTLKVTETEPEPEPGEHVDEAERPFAPQLPNDWPLRASMAVTAAAYDQVRSTADVGVPLFFRNCSESPPFGGVYFATIATNPSAKVCTAEVMDLYAVVELAYVPTEAEEYICWKKGSERDVMLREP
jgi:hypothetical protein